MYNIFINFIKNFFINNNNNNNNKKCKINYFPKDLLIENTNYHYIN